MILIMAMNETILKILRDYGDGKLTIEEANEKLSDPCANFSSIL